jgi:alkanesulfonate monooxygenase SsuD/methylene tetrahydromethanopterin reductase-like flavin-dependent oxidoreductase (luciferase family)
LKFGVYIPNFGEMGDPHVLVNVAQTAEAAGWDGVFLWDHIRWNEQVIPMADPWIALTAMAANTARIKLGSSVTPLPRRRPWKLARETVTLDQLSNGRLILGIGLGGSAEAEFGAFGDTADPKLRGEQLDEGLQILSGLWSGEPFSFEGKHYHLKTMQFLPKPVQTPRIPIWLGGTWGAKRAAFRRAAQWDGVFPVSGRPTPLTPEEIAELVGYIKQHRANDAPFDVAIALRSGENAEDDAMRIRAYSDAGLTWWQENCSHSRFPLALAMERIRQGPPKVG